MRLNLAQVLPLPLKRPDLLLPPQALQPFAEGFCYDDAGTNLALSNSNGISSSDYWETGHMASYSGMNYSESDVAEIYRWEATRAGVARLNFAITYKDEAGVEHKTVLYGPLTFSIYSHN